MNKKIKKKLISKIITFGTQMLIFKINKHEIFIIISNSISSTSI